MRAILWYTAAVGIEGHTEEDVGGTLIELAGQPAIGHIKLEQAVTGRQRHLVHKRRVPGRHDVTPRIRVCLDALDEFGHLVDMPAVIIRPGAPLRAIDRPEVPVLIGPLVPDADTVLLEIADIGIALQEPEQFVNDRPQMQPLRRDDREAIGKIETHLMAEDRPRARAGAVTAVAAILQHVAKEVVILVHGSIIESLMQASYRRRRHEPMRFAGYPRIASRRSPGVEQARCRQAS